MRECTKCEQMYRPNGKSQKLCVECQMQIRNRMPKEPKYWCVHCGEKFKYKNNKESHERKCNSMFITPKKWNNVIPK